MKTNFNTSIYIFIDGFYSFPTTDVHSLFESLNVYSSWKMAPYGFEASICSSKNDLTIRNMVSQISSCFDQSLNRLSSLSTLFDLNISDSVDTSHLFLNVLIKYMEQTFTMTIPFRYFHFFYSDLTISTRSSSILNTLNFYSLKYPLVK